MVRKSAWVAGGMQVLTQNLSLKFSHKKLCNERSETDLNGRRENNGVENTDEELSVIMSNLK